MLNCSGRLHRKRMTVLRGVSLIALVGLAAAGNAATLRPGYSPAANNGGGRSPGRADIITLTNTTDRIGGDYALRNTSAKRFLYNPSFLSDRFAKGEVISGYDAVDGRGVLALGAEQKTRPTTYPDQIRGTTVATLVYDNDRLGEAPSTNTVTYNYVDTNRPVYGDLRLANISNSNVTIATGDKGRSVYDNVNFALLTADSGSTLYNVTAGSSVLYDSRTAMMSGADQNGLSQAATQRYDVPVTNYSGIAFNGTDRVTDLASLKRYNTSLIAQLTAGAITPAQYDGLVRSAARTTTEQVVVRNNLIPPYVAPPTVSRRAFIRLTGSSLTTTVDSQLVGVVLADGNDDGGTTLLIATNGSSVINNGSIAHAGHATAIKIDGAGSSLTNSTTGVIGVGYETLTRTGGGLVPGGLGDEGYRQNNIAIAATNGAVIANAGIINVANRDIAPGNPLSTASPQAGKANVGILAATGSNASNSGTILIGGADSAVANALGSFRGAVGMAAADGGTAVNAAGGTIRIGTSFAENAVDLTNVADVLSINYASGMASLSGGGAIVNDGTIRIGGRAQNATGMMVGGEGNTAVNNGTIVIDSTASAAPKQRNAGLAVLGGGAVGVVNATNAATGLIEISGINGVGLLVANEVQGGAARAVNDGRIVVNGGISADGLRSYGIFVDNAASSALHGGVIALNGEGAIGVHARNGGTVDVAQNGTVDFRAARQIGYYALGNGSTINIGSTTNVDSDGSTGLRVEGGAVARGGDLTFGVSGANAVGIVATGTSLGTTVETNGMSVDVSGFGAVGVLVEGGATGLIGAGSDIRLTGARTTAAVVDGQARGIDGVNVGAAIATTSLTASANLLSSSIGVTGYAARNQGQLVNSGNIGFTGADGVGIAAASGANVRNSGAISLGGGAGVGIDLTGAGTTAVHTGAISGSGIGVRISTGASFTNNGGVSMTSGTGILVDGAGSVLTGTGSAPVQVANGVAALRLINGGSVDTAGAFAANGTAHAILVDAGAGALTLGAGPITAGGTGNGVENAANSTTIRLNGTSITANGSGAGVRTAVSLDPFSTAVLTAAGADSTGFLFAGADNAATTGNLTLNDAFVIRATGAGATGVRLNTSGNATLSGRIEVTNAAGGSSIVAGPAGGIANNGTLTSASTSAPVVDLTGGATAFVNNGTVTAASPAATAIQGGGNGQSVTFASGAVTGAVALGGGNDTFLMTGGTLTGAFSAGGGNDTATFRGLTDTNLSGVTAIAGNGAVGGNDTLTFDNTVATGTRRLTGWNNVGLANGTRLTSDGDLTLAGGTLSIGSDSTYLAGGLNSVIGAGVGSSATVVNVGTIDLTNGASGPTDSLTIRGNYVGQNGTLRLQTVLAGDGAQSDRLIIDGGAVSGSTTIQVVNAGGLGAQTTGNGIELISAVNGGTTTALTTGSGFTLAGGQVDAGAFEYRLFASNQAGTSQSWFLRTQGSSQTEEPIPPVEPEPTFRVEAPLLSALPNVLRQGDLEMLGTYHRRMGDENGTLSPGFTTPGQMWGRAIVSDGRYRQRGEVRPETDGTLYGFQLGVALFRFGGSGGHHDVGIYGGYTNGSYNVRGFASGVEDAFAGRLKPNAAYAGLYWTYVSDNGLYVDTVVQRSWYDGSARAANGNRIGTDGVGILASVETGYAIPVTRQWVIEPQAQIIAQGVSIDDVAIPNAYVQFSPKGQVTGRLGLRARGALETGVGGMQSYIRANLWKAFASTDRVSFATPATRTIIRTPNSSLWGDAGVGLTWSLTSNVAVYGEATHRFTLDNGQGVAGHATAGSIGVKFNL